MGPTLARAMTLLFEGLDPSLDTPAGHHLHGVTVLSANDRRAQLLAPQVATTAPELIGWIDEAGSDWTVVLRILSAGYYNESLARLEVEPRMVLWPMGGAERRARASADGPR